MIYHCGSLKQSLASFVATRNVVLKLHEDQKCPHGLLSLKGEKVEEASWLGGKKRKKKINPFTDFVMTMSLK